MKSYKDIKKVEYLGPTSKDPFSFKFYNPDEVIAGKKMREHLKFALSWWHTMDYCGVDMFGGPTEDKNFGQTDPMKIYEAKADLAFVNQETILGGGKASGYPYFNTPDEMAGNLHDVGFDVVNGATNHALDQGYDGVQHSIEVFRKYQDMTYIGLYESQEERDTIQVVEKDGIRIAFLAYNQMIN